MTDASSGALLATVSQLSLLRGNGGFGPGGIVCAQQHRGSTPPMVRATSPLKGNEVDLGPKDKVAIVTGSARGIGAATARRLAEEDLRACP